VNSRRQPKMVQRQNQPPAWTSSVMWVVSRWHSSAVGLENFSHVRGFRSVKAPSRCPWKWTVRSTDAGARLCSAAQSGAARSTGVPTIRRAPSRPGSAPWPGLVPSVSHLTWLRSAPKMTRLDHGCALRKGVAFLKGRIRNRQMPSLWLDRMAGALPCVIDSECSHA
jgi:hypothetical protein